jgi:hypothetical protein
MTSSWTPLGIDDRGTIRTCFEQIYPISAAGAVVEVEGGSGVSVGGTPTAPVIYNTGVLSINAGLGIGLSGSAQTPTVRNTGVLAVQAGEGISIQNTDQLPEVNNEGVLSVTAGTGITTGGTAKNPVVNNAGVLSVTAGTNITLGGTASNPVINAASSSNYFGPGGDNTQDSTTALLDEQGGNVWYIDVPFYGGAGPRRQAFLNILMSAPASPTSTIQNIVIRTSINGLAAGATSWTVITESLQLPDNAGGWSGMQTAYPAPGPGGNPAVNHSLWFDNPMPFTQIVGNWDNKRVFLKFTIVPWGS